MSQLKTTWVSSVQKAIFDQEMGRQKKNGDQKLEGAEWYKLDVCMYIYKPPLRRGCFQSAKIYGKLKNK